MSTFDPTLPQPQGTDKLLNVIRTLVAGVPFVGGSVTEAWADFFRSPLTKRREEWLLHLAIAVAHLQKERAELTLDSLQQNEAFISAVLTATSIAVRTHQKEKLIALRSAAISSVLNTDILEDEQSLFMRYLDEFTPWHLRVLSAFHDPNGHFQRRGVARPWLVDRNGTLWSSSKDTFLFMGQAFPELQSQHQFRGVLLYDLGVRHLISITHIPQPLPDIGPYTTIMGQKFMRFIESVTDSP